MIKYIEICKKKKQNKTKYKKDKTRNTTMSTEKKPSVSMN